MDVSAEIMYPHTTPQEAFALVTNANFREEVCRATQALTYDVDIDASADGTATVVVRRAMPADVPDLVKRIVGETVDVVQTERWAAPNAAGERTADLTLQVRNQPGSMKGTAAITATADGARTSIRGELSVAIPFVGKKVQPLVAAAILAAIDVEQQIVDKWLGESS